jgi:hypothetical protein
MIPHPTTMMHVVTELRRQDLLTTAELSAKRPKCQGRFFPGGKWPFVP